MASSVFPGNDNGQYKGAILINKGNMAIYVTYVSVKRFNQLACQDVYTALNNCNQMHWSSVNDMKFLVTQSFTAFIFLVHSSILHNFPDITSKFRITIMFAMFNTVNRELFHAVFVCLFLIIFTCRGSN